MSLQLKSFSIIALCLWFVGCAKVVNTDTLNSDVRPLLSSVDIFLNVEQKQLLVDGLSGEEDALLNPVRDNIALIKYERVIAHEIEEKLFELNWLNAEELKFSQRAEVPVETSLQKSAASAVIFIDADYKLTNALDAIELTADVFMVGKDAQLDKFEKKDILYKKQFMIKTPIETQGDQAARVAKLEEKYSLSLKQQLRNTARELAQTLQADLSR